MTPDVVVDVGNSRIKCGIVRDGVITSSFAWDFDKNHWHADDVAGTHWLIAGVNPKPQQELLNWLNARNASTTMVHDYRMIPLRVDVDAPERVGIDRLLGAVCASRLKQAEAAAITVDLGTATTINLITPDGTFRGGFILPGLNLMATSLHRGTAQLPTIELTGSITFPARNTDDAIRGGIVAATCGAIQNVLSQVRLDYSHVELFITGGASAYLKDELQGWSAVHRPNLVLDGLLAVAGTLP